MLSLSELKKQLQIQPKNSLQELCTRLQENQETVYCLLQHFMSRGQVIECPYKPACQTSCRQCGQANIIYYSWCQKD